MTQLTDRERQVFDAVRRGIDTSGRAPSGTEIATSLGVSPKTAYEYLRRLEGHGLLALESGGRGVPLKVRLTPRAQARRGRAFPRFGRIPAGPLTDVVAQADDFVSGLPDVMPWIQEGDYLLEVEGDSMIGAGLTEGMTLVMRPNLPPQPGDICSFYIEGEGNTLKRFVPRRGDAVTLKPENPRYQPRTYSADEVLIQGVLVGALSVLRFR